MTAIENKWRAQCGARMAAAMSPQAAFCVAALTLAVSLAAQTPGFEVASIRRHTASDILSSGGTQPDSGYAAFNITLRNLLVGVYSLPPSRIVGGPDWADSERWDIQAKGPRTNNARANLEALLAERFALVIRRERREFPAYFLVKATADGRLGPNLRPARFNCNDPDGIAAAAAANARDPKSPPCAIRQAPGRILAGAVSLNQIVGYLGTGRPVLDRTGLQGRFDVALEWTPTPDAADGVSIFTAVREQLGLRLDNGRTMLDVIVVERAERPRPQ